MRNKEKLKQTEHLEWMMNTKQCLHSSHQGAWDTDVARGLQIGYAWKVWPIEIFISVVFP